MKKSIGLLAFLFIFSGCGGSTEIAGISDAGGCGPFEFDNDFDVEEFVEVIRNDCPFTLTFRFLIEQNGCKLTLEDAGPQGEDLHGVIDSQGFYGVEVKGADGTLYECQGDAVADASRGTYLMHCEYGEAAFCRFEADQIATVF